MQFIKQSEYQSYVDRNKRNIQADPQTYKPRQQIIEHTYGVVKRQWGFYYVVTRRGMKRASADVGLMCTALNLRRIMNLVDKKLLQKFLQELLPSIFHWKSCLQSHFQLHYSICFFFVQD
ncbi:MAG TPA: transposase [Ginsengibacter sp.]|nr:transposase [Ginsengibacter sp.]HRP43371.1 transposase [Ginsengibacter sp.]